VTRRFVPAAKIRLKVLSVVSVSAWMELCSLRDEQWHSIDAPLLAPPRVVFVPADCRPLLLFGWIRVVAVVGRGHRAVQTSGSQWS
jgi:hypothetical protein